MDERKDKAKQIAHQMNQREKIYQKDVPTREQARDIVEKRKALEKQKQNTTSRVVHVSTDTKKKNFSHKNIIEYQEAFNKENLKSNKKEAAKQPRKTNSDSHEECEEKSP